MKCSRAGTLKAILVKIPVHVPDREQCAMRGVAGAAMIPNGSTHQMVLEAIETPNFFPITPTLTKNLHPAGEPPTPMSAAGDSYVSGSFCHHPPHARAGNV